MRPRIRALRAEDVIHYVVLFTKIQDLQKLG